MKIYQLEQIEPRKRQIAGADHQRHEKISQHRGDRRDQKEKHHDDAVHREQLVVGLRLHQIALRRQQLQAHQAWRNAPPMKKKNVIDEQIKHRDALVIGGQQPRLHAVADIEIMSRSRRPAGWDVSLPFDLSLPSAGLKRFDIGDDLQHAFFADLTLERRHDRLIAGDDLGARIENRFAKVVFVGEQRAAVLQLYRFAEQPYQRRAACTVPLGRDS